MSDFEIVTLFNDLLNTCFARLNDFMVGLFAMLVTAWFAAHELNRRMVMLVISLYTVFCVATIVPTLATCNRFARAGALVRDAGEQPGSNLDHIFTTLPDPGVVNLTMIFLLIGAYSGGIMFFFQARRRRGGEPPENSR